MRPKLTEALELRRSKRLEESKEKLLSLVQETDEADPLVLFECACAHDLLGLEVQAIPYYEKALEAGLSEPQRKTAYTNLGSSYRCIGEYEQAEAILLQAQEQYPEDEVVKVFLAMTRYNLGKTEDCVRELLHVIVRLRELNDRVEYQRAIAFYAEHLEEIWR